MYQVVPLKGTGPETWEAGHKLYIGKLWCNDPKNLNFIMNNWKVSRTTAYECA